MKLRPSDVGKANGPARGARVMRYGAGLSLAVAAALVAWTATQQPARAQEPARIAPAGVTNIAAASYGARIVYQSSLFEDNAAYSAKNLIDGQIYDPVHKSGSFGWVSKQFDPVHREQVTIALPGDKVWRIGKIVLNPASNTIPERWAKDVEVQVANDINGPFRVVSEVTLRREPVAQPFLLFPTEAKFVRLEISTNWCSDQAVALGEVEIYEAIDTTKPLGMLIDEFEQAYKDLLQYRQIQIEQANGGQSSGAHTAAPVRPTASDTKPLAKAGSAARGGMNTAIKTAPRRPVDSVPARQSLRDRQHASALNTRNEATVHLIQLLSNKAERMYPISPENLAAKANGGHIVDYTSIFENNPAYSPNNLIDGEVFTPGDVPEHDKGTKGWASDAFSPSEKPQYVTIGFKDDATHVIGKIVLNPTSDQIQMRWATKVQVQVSTESPKNGPWQNVAVLTIPLEARPQDYFIQPVEAKYVRFTFLANGPGDFPLPKQPPGVSSDRSVSLGEISIFEISNQGDQLDAVIDRLRRVLQGLKELNDTGGVKAATMPGAAGAKADRVETVDLLEQALSAAGLKPDQGTM